MREGGNVPSFEPTQGNYVWTNDANQLWLAQAQNGASAYTAVSSSDDNTVTEAVSDYNSYASSTKSAMAQWNTHSYGGGDADRNNAYANIRQGDGKRLWMSEWGIGSQGSPINAALALSRQVLDDEQHLHPVTWVGWQAVNEVGDTPNDVWGLAYRDSNNNISYPSRYYAMGNYSKFLRPGYTMIGNSDANTLTGYNASSHSLVIVATNSSTSSTSATYNLSNFSSVGGVATPYQTSASQNLAQIANVSIAGKTFSTTLPAQSITTFVIPNVTYSNATSGYYEIVNSNSGQLLDVSNGSTTVGASVIQWTNTGGTNQQWSLVAVSGGAYEIVNRHSGQLMDVSSGSTTAGASVIQWTNNGGTNQQWSLVPV